MRKTLGLLQSACKFLVKGCFALTKIANFLYILNWVVNVDPCKNFLIWLKYCYKGFAINGLFKTTQFA